MELIKRGARENINGGRERKKDNDLGHVAVRHKNPCGHAAEKEREREGQ